MSGRRSISSTRNKTPFSVDVSGRGWALEVGFALVVIAVTSVLVVTDRASPG